MNSIFCLLGYGIPKNIFKDENYNFYLKITFNKIYSLIIKNKVKQPIIICSGGKTDCYRPYKRNEADEMIKLLKKLANRPFLRSITKSWKFIAERSSISTLENFLNLSDILSKKRIKKTNLYIFCEQTREKRIKILAKKILKNYNFLIIPIDFDVSPNRYIGHNFLAEKERAELKHNLWALQSSENLKKHHKIFKERINYLRKAGPNIHTKALREWWEKKINELNN